MTAAKSGEPDYDWMKAKLNDFAQGAKPMASPGAVGPYVYRHAMAEDALTGRAPVVERILDVITPTWRTTVPKSTRDHWEQHRTAAVRAISVIHNRDEIAAKLGDTAPKLSASSLHPWVWEAAKSLWQSGHYRQAVGAAAIKVNAETQNKANNRKLSEQALFNVVLSFDRTPKVDNPRFILDGDDGTPTADSERRGARSLSEACYALFRNPVSHTLGDLAEEEALQQLAAFSILAQLIEKATVVTAP